MTNLPTFTPKENENVMPQWIAFVNERLAVLSDTADAVSSLTLVVLPLLDKFGDNIPEGIDLTAGDLLAIRASVERLSHALDDGHVEAGHDSPLIDVPSV